MNPRGHHTSEHGSDHVYCTLCHGSKPASSVIVAFESPTVSYQGLLVEVVGINGIGFAPDFPAVFKTDEGTFRKTTIVREINHRP
jgi:hypothetical protein